MVEIPKPHPYYLQERARLLRAQGDSLGVISNVLGIPRSTVGEWISGMREEVAMVRYCERCKGAFLARRSDTRFCPDRCGMAVRVPKPPKALPKCEYCKEPFKRVGGSRWCCDEHRDLAKKQRVCKWCKKTFIARLGQERYCCEEHKHEAAKDSQRVKRRPKRLCPYCQVKFTPHHGGQKFCCSYHQRFHQQNRGEERERELVAA